MSKDAKGHGSNGRGAEVQRMVNSIAASPNFEGAKMPYHMAADMNTGPHAPSNAMAASQLASGAKSAPIPTHDSMGRTDGNGVSLEGDYGKNLSAAYSAKHGWNGDVGAVGSGAPGSSRDMTSRRAASLERLD